MCTHTHTHTQLTQTYTSTHSKCATILIQGDSFLTSASYNSSTHFQETEGGLLIYFGCVSRQQTPWPDRLFLGLLWPRERHSEETEESKYGSVLKYHFDILSPKMSISTHLLPLLHNISERSIVLFISLHLLDSERQL